MFCSCSCFALSTIVLFLGLLHFTFCLIGFVSHVDCFTFNCLFLLPSLPHISDCLPEPLHLHTTPCDPASSLQKCLSWSRSQRIWSLFQEQDVKQDHGQHMESQSIMGHTLSGTQSEANFKLSALIHLKYHVF